MKTTTPTDNEVPTVHDVVVRVCQDCIDLKGQECHVPECVFCFRGMGEVKHLLDRMLICPVIDNERFVLAGNAALEELAKEKRIIAMSARADLAPTGDAGCEWQPIETCPFGTQVLLLWQGRTPEPHYERVIGTIPVNNEWKREQYWNGQRGDYQSLDPIVAWQTLPAPPEGKERK